MNTTQSLMVFCLTDGGHYNVKQTTALKMQYWKQDGPHSRAVKTTGPEEKLPGHDRFSPGPVVCPALLMRSVIFQSCVFHRRDDRPTAAPRR